MIFASVPTIAAAKVDVKEASAKTDAVWDRLAREEKALAEKYPDREEYLDAVYALYGSQKDITGLKRESADRFSFRVGYIPCAYNYELRQKALYTVEGKGEDATIRTSYGTKTHGSDVFLVGPYYGYQDSFTDYYKNLANTLGEKYGGMVTIISGNNATGPAIRAYLASAENNVITIYDSHGGADSGSSYLCLHTGTGLTAEDYEKHWAVSFSSDYYGIDGRYMTNGMTYEFNDNMFWCAICEGMMTDGLCKPLRASGAGVVYGYSQSVSFTGDYEFADVFWDCMMDGATVAEAIEQMKARYGYYDHYVDPYAYPIVVSAQDVYPINPDSVQTVYSQWTVLKGPDPVAVTGLSLDITEATILDKCENTIQLNYEIEPVTATNKVVEWTSSDEDVAVVSDRGLVTAVSEGEATITVTTQDGGFTATCKITVNEASFLLYEDFEDFNEAEWTFVDSDGDGRNWFLSDSEHDNVYEGTHCIASASYANSTALTPDNWLISPAFTATADARLSWYDAPKSTSYAKENYSVYVLPADYSALDEGIIVYNGIPASSYTRRTVDIGSFYGQNIRIAFRHHDVTDMYRLNVDLIAVLGSEGAEPVFTTGVSLNVTEAVLLEKIESTIQLTAAVEPADATNKNVTWSSSDEDILTVDGNGFVTAKAAGEAVVTVTTVEGGFTAECRITVVEPEFLFIEDFEDFDTEEWTLVDADGDGYNWYIVSADKYRVYEGEYCIASASYDNDEGALTPDNWMISPLFTATEDAMLFWYDVAQDPDWSHENYSVYVLPADYAELDEAVCIYNGEPGGEYELHKISMDAYAGQEIRIAFRHHDCTDNFVLSIDVIAVTNKTPEKHTVTFVDGCDDSVIATAIVEDGADVEFPEAPEHSGYVFIGWDGDGKNITEDTTITAQYVYNQHTIVFFDGLTNEFISFAVINHGEVVFSPNLPFTRVIRSSAGITTV